MTEIIDSGIRIDTGDPVGWCAVVGRRNPYHPDHPIVLKIVGPKGGLHGELECSLGGARTLADALLELAFALEEVKP